MVLPFSQYSPAAQKLMLYMNARGTIRVDLTDKLTYHPVNNMFVDDSQEIGPYREVNTFAQFQDEMAFLCLDGVVTLDRISDSEVHFRPDYRALHMVLLTQPGFQPRISLRRLGIVALAIVPVLWAYPTLGISLAVIYTGISTTSPTHTPGTSSRSFASGGNRSAADRPDLHRGGFHLVQSHS